jgi:phenylacetaldehyde dehydrogenase
MVTTASQQIHPQVAEFIDKPRKMLINGQWVNAISGKTFPTYNPATGDVLAQVAEGDSADIEQAVKAARKAFDHGPWRKLTASERGRLIWKLADLLEAHTEEFAYLESLDNGKPLTIARAADVPLAVDLFRYMAGWATKIEGQFPCPTPPARSISPTRCVSPSELPDRSSPGISPCSWPHGNWVRRFPPAARSF